MVLCKAAGIAVVRFGRDASTLPPSCLIPARIGIFAPMFGLETWPQVNRRIPLALARVCKPDIRAPGGRAGADGTAS